MYEPWASALGGIVGGLICYPSTLVVTYLLKIDDPVDAISVRAPVCSLDPKAKAKAWAFSILMPM